MYLQTHLPNVAAAGIAIVLLGTVSAPITRANAQAPSTFQNSCRNLTIAGNTLAAECRRIDGSFAQTSILLRGIANNDGTLTIVGLGSQSSFQNSCSNIQITGITLTATCRRMNGSSNNSSILLPGIGNDNGVLKY
jgi:hypothetical protein